MNQPNSRLHKPIERSNAGHPSQRQLCDRSHRQVADLNLEFMALANHPTNPLTREDLEANIARRPTLWGRFSGYLGTLPSRSPPRLSSIERGSDG